MDQGIAVYLYQSQIFFAKGLKKKFPRSFLNFSFEISFFLTGVRLPKSFALHVCNASSLACSFIYVYKVSKHLFCNPPLPALYSFSLSDSLSIAISILFFLYIYSMYLFVYLSINFRFSLSPSHTRFFHVAYRSEI